MPPPPLLREVENKAKFIIAPIGGIHIGRMAPLVIFVLWFGYISQHGGGGLLLTVDDYYLSSRLLGEEAEDGSIYI
jgi:hypothetical protein